MEDLPKTSGGVSPNLRVGELADAVSDTNREVQNSAVNTRMAKGAVERRSDSFMGQRLTVKLDGHGLLSHLPKRTTLILSPIGRLEITISLELPTNLLHGDSLAT